MSQTQKGLIREMTLLTEAPPKEDILLLVSPFRKFCMQRSEGLITSTLGDWISDDAEVACECL